jgi:hypothetical protein
MAAGIIYQTISTTSGETLEMAFYVDNTASPTTWKPISVLVGADGTVLSGADGILLDSTQFGEAVNTPQLQTVTFQVVDRPYDGHAFSDDATFTPAAASPQTAGDVNGAAAEFAFGAPSACRLMITSATLRIDSTTAVATEWRLHLYNITPPSALADGTAWDLPSGDRASYLGYISFTTSAANDTGSTQWVESHGINKQIKLAGTSVFGYLQNVSSVNIANVDHVVTLHAVLV